MALPRHFVIGVLMFSVIIVGGIFLATSFNVTDGVDSFNSTFNKAGAITNYTNAIRLSIETAQSDFGAFGVLNGLISSAWNGLGLLFGIADLGIDLFNSSADFLNIPPEALTVITLLSAVVIVIIAFSIWSAIFQKEI